MSSTAGSTALVDISDINREALVENRVYLNVNNGAETSGTVYSWTYCYSQDNDPPPYELVIAMYRQQQNGVYQLVPGSYRRLKINVSLGQPNSFNCNNIDLQTSEYFAIQRNDVVAVCEPFNVVRIEVLFSDRSTSLKGWNANSCSENTISSSGSVGDISGRYFLLKATISKALFCTKEQIHAIECNNIRGLYHLVTSLGHSSMFCPNYSFSTPHFTIY